MPSFPRFPILCLLVAGCADCSGDDPPDSTESVDITPGEAAVLSLSSGIQLAFRPIDDPTPRKGPYTRARLIARTTPTNIEGIELQAITPEFELEVESFDATAFANVRTGSVGTIPASAFRPTLTIPKELLGAPSKDVLAFARVGDLLVNGEIERDAIRFLPALEEGDNYAFTDFYFPSTVLTSLEDDAAGASGGLSGSRTHRVRYTALSALTSVNWANNPVLARMIPSATAPYRVPLADLEQTDPAAATLEKERCVRNLVVLVHGHNEEEGRGFSTGAAPLPWSYAYKRDAWSLLYKNLSNHDLESRLGCTAFFEFIYPTYRPIMSPHGTQERLDEAFAATLARELAPWISSGQDYRLFVVAHSMGGPVSRAGIQLMDEKLHTWFQKLVTWGSPHLGSPLPSLAFALAATPPYVIHTPPGWRAASVDFSGDDVLNELLVEAISLGQLPAPGPRDYRWAGSDVNPSKHEMRLENVLDLSADQLATPVLAARFDLQTGSWVNNANLRQVNANDRYVHSDKYAALYGVTPKRPTWKTTAFGYVSYPDPSSTTQTGIGAMALELLMDSVPNYFLTLNKNESDGAVPLESMIGSGVFGLLGLSYLPDVDHEEYYGAPDATGTFIETAKAEATGDRTREVLGFLDDTFKCPELKFTAEPPPTGAPGATVEVQGTLEWTGDASPGKRIEAISLAGSTGKSSNVSFGEDGSFTGQLSLLASEGDDRIELTVSLKDKTKLTRAWFVSVAGGGFDFDRVKVYVDIESPRFLKDGLDYGGYEICSGPNDAGYVYFPSEQGRRFSGTWTGLRFQGSAGSTGSGSGTITLTMAPDYSAINALEVNYTGGASDLRGFAGVSGHFVAANIPVLSNEPDYMAEFVSEGAASISELTYAVSCPSGSPTYELDLGASRGVRVLVRFEPGL